MQGTREERGVLIRDPNRLVSSAVLSSPKLTESEVEAIARMTNVSDEVLRIVGTTRSWIKNYNVIAALARNAKTPVAISLTLAQPPRRARRQDARDRPQRPRADSRRGPEALRARTRPGGSDGQGGRDQAALPDGDQGDHRPSHRAGDRAPEVDGQRRGARARGGLHGRAGGRCGRSGGWRRAPEGRQPDRIADNGEAGRASRQPAQQGWLRSPF